MFVSGNIRGIHIQEIEIERKKKDISNTQIGDESIKSRQKKVRDIHPGELSNRD